MTFYDLPLRAQHVLIGFASAYELDTLKLLEKPKTAHEKRLRYLLWKALRSETDCRGNPIYTERQIADWFGVSRSHVHVGVQRASDKAPLTEMGVDETQT